MEKSVHPDCSVFLGLGEGHGVVVCAAITIVDVRPGDLIVADGDAVICIPRDDADAVVTAAQAKMRKEDEAAEKVRAGGACRAARPLNAASVVAGGEHRDGIRSSQVQVLARDGGTVCPVRDVLSPLLR